jgi:hypothetical protein
LLRQRSRFAHLCPAFHAGLLESCAAVLAPYPSVRSFAEGAHAFGAAVDASGTDAPAFAAGAAAATGEVRAVANEASAASVAAGRRDERQPYPTSKANGESRSSSSHSPETFDFIPSTYVRAAN